jgi:hypothetical protein
MYAQMVDTESGRANGGEMSADERAFQARIDADIKIDLG